MLVVGHVVGVARVFVEGAVRDATRRHRRREVVAVTDAGVTVRRRGRLVTVALHRFVQQMVILLQRQQ